MIYLFHYLKKNEFHFRLLIISLCLITICLIKTERSKAQEHFNLNEYIESLGDYPDDSLAYILYQKSQDYINADSLEFANELLFNSIEIAKQQHDTLQIGLCRIRQGEVFNRLLKFNNSFQAYNHAYNISKELNDTNIMIRAMRGIEEYYYQLEMIDSAITYCTSAIEINKLIKNYAKLADNYRALYSYQRYTTGEIILNAFVLDGLMDSCLSAAKKSKNPEIFCNALTCFGLIIYDTDIEKAFQCMQKARDSARKLPAPSRALVFALTKSSTICLEDNQTKQARIFLNEALPLAIKTNHTRQLTNIYFLFGDLLHAEDSIPQAIPYYYKAISLAEKYRYKYYLPFIYESLIDIYQSNNNLDRSSDFQEKYMEAFRKKHDREMNIQIAKLSAKYQIDNKNEAIDNLTIINDQKKTIIANQRKFIISLALAIIAISALFVFMYYYFKKIRKAHRKLSQNAIELNIKNKEISELKRKRNQQLEVIHDDLKDKLEELFENGEIYTKKELTLNSTSQALKTNTSYLSGIINQDYDCNFNQFVNQYRVKKACEFLSDRKKDVYTIESLGDSVGFKSKSAFYHAFKEITGVNPSTFRKNSAN